MTPIRGFFSGFVGSAAVETYLLGYAGRHPAAYMGAKTQYRAAILGAMGLRFGQGAERSVWCDGGPWGLVWQVLATPGGAEAVAARLWSWAGEDPRALWERLAREPVPGDAAHSLATMAGRYAGDGTGGPRGGHSLRPNPANRFSPQIPSVAARVEAVARFLVLQHGAFGSAPLMQDGGNGWRRPARPGRGHEAATHIGRAKAAPVVAGRLAYSPHGVEVINADISVALALLPEDLAGWYAYLDPPYVGCTPYALDCPRERVVGIALDLAARGAVVAVSEGVPVEELTAAGWHTLDIGHVRRSQRWTARQAGEWLTMSREPARVPARQERLFA